MILELQEQILSLFQGSPLYVASQIYGLCLCVLSFFIYYVKKREHILITKLIADVLSGIQQAMVGASTGALINGIAAVRDLIFTTAAGRNGHPISCGCSCSFLL